MTDRDKASVTRRSWQSSRKIWLNVTPGHTLSHKCCPECGHPVPSDRVAFALPGTQRRLYEVVRDAGMLGITNDQAMSKLYGHRADGGPATPNIVSVILWHVNQKLKPFGLEIRSQGGPGAVYRLKEIDHERPARRSRHARHQADDAAAGEPAAGGAS